MRNGEPRAVEGKDGARQGNVDSQFYCAFGVFCSFGSIAGVSCAFRGRPRVGVGIRPAASLKASQDTPSAVASAMTVSQVGERSPRSIRLIVPFSTPAFDPSSGCVKPAATRNSLNRAPNVALPMPNPHRKMSKRLPIYFPQNKPYGLDVESQHAYYNRARQSKQTDL